MTAGKILRYLANRQFQVGLDKSGLNLVIRPAPDEALLARVRARKGDLLALLHEHVPANRHRYVVWSGTDDRSMSVCLSCGIPPVLHGDACLDDPLLVKDPNDAVLLNASCVVASAAAESLSSDFRRQDAS